MSTWKRLVKAVFWIAFFAAVGFALVKLSFELVCWISGHDMVEATVGLLASLFFGTLFGIEFFLRFRDWQWQRNREKAVAGHASASPLE